MPRARARSGMCWHRLGQAVGGLAASLSRLVPELAEPVFVPVVAATVMRFPDRAVLAQIIEVQQQHSTRDRWTDTHHCPAVCRRICKFPPQRHIWCIENSFDVIGIT